MKRAIIICLVAGMLITGSVNTISKKVGYDTCSKGEPGIKGTPTARGALAGQFPCPKGERKFQKPWTQTLVMFTGEACCLLYFLWDNRKRRARRAARADAAVLNDVAGSNNPAKSPLSPLYNFFSPSLARAKFGGRKGGGGGGGDGDDGKPILGLKDLGWRNVLVCWLPACCDLGGTTVSGIGLLFISASSFQMLRGSIIIFTGILSWLILKRRQQGFHWLGMALVVVGIGLVGVAGYMNEGEATKAAHHAAANKAEKERPSWQPILGVVLVIVSQLLSAFQMVVEEKYLKKRQLPPAFVVGCEGCFGMAMMLCVVLPIVAHLPGQDGDGVHESAIDAAVLISHSGSVLAAVLAYFFSISFYNFFGLSVAKNLSSVHRTLIDACRTTLVWSTDLILFYASYKHQYGERWGPDSWVQLVGFLTMVAGTFIYYNVVRVPCARLYDDAAKEEEDEEAKQPLLGDRNDEIGGGTFGTLDAETDERARRDSF